MEKYYIVYKREEKDSDIIGHLVQFVSENDGIGKFFHHGWRWNEYIKMDDVKEVSKEDYERYWEVEENQDDIENYEDKIYELVEEFEEKYGVQYQ